MDNLPGGLTISALELIEMKGRDETTDVRLT
jgi:hypothetical protein